MDVYLLAGDNLPLRCEACTICKKHPAMLFPKDKLDTGITGLATIIDIHGLSFSTPHVRLLYVDDHGSVRSFKIITEITGDEKILKEIKNLKGIF